MQDKHGTFKVVFLKMLFGRYLFSYIIISSINKYSLWHPYLLWTFDSINGLGIFIVLVILGGTEVMVTVGKSYKQMWIV